MQVHELANSETLGLRKAPIAEMQLFDERHEQPDNGDIAEREEECPHIGNAEQIDDSMGEANPEKAHRPERRHGVGLAGKMDGDDQRREWRKILARVEVGPLGTLAPWRQ